MKVAKKVVFKFNPDNAGIPALTDFYGRILWACIKTGHITNQYFNGEVQAVALQLNKKFPESFEKFKGLIRMSGLTCFGVKTDEFMCGLKTAIGDLDDEFWQGIYDYLTKKKTLKIVIDI